MKLGDQLLPLLDDLHPAPAAARRRLDDDRVADLLDGFDRLLVVFDEARAGEDRDARRGHRGARRDLGPHQAHQFRLRSDEAQPAALAHLGELGVLREEAVAGVDRVGAGDLGRRDDRRDVEVGLLRRGRPDADALVGELDVQRVGVDRRVDRDGADPELARSADHPQRDLAAVGDQDLLEQLGHVRSGSGRGARRTPPAARSRRGRRRSSRPPRPRSRSSASSPR